MEPGHERAGAIDVDRFSDAARTRLYLQRMVEERLIGVASRPEPEGVRFQEDLPIVFVGSSVSQIE